MKRKILITFISILTIQISQAQKNKCDCSNVFDDLIQKLESNYIGLALLRKNNQDETYEKRKIEFKRRISGISSENCTDVIQEFLGYFKDGHLFVYELPKYTQDEILTIKKKIKESKLSTKEIFKTLSNQKSIAKKSEFDSILGLWTDGKSNIIVIKNQGLYKAYIANSELETVESGELKAVFAATDHGFYGTYYSYDYSQKYIEGNIYKEGTLLVLTGANYWKKIKNINSLEKSTNKKQDIRLPSIKKLDEKNTLFSIPSFMVDHQEFNKVILDNLILIKNTTNLIIDIRGNVGGNALYFSFLDAYATQPMQSKQGLVLGSNDTKAYFERFAKNAPEVYGPVVKRIEKNIGQILNGPEYPERKFEPFESKIQNVAILTDNGCMSAAESFILHSKAASNKVTVFGSPTGGVIDYTSINTLKLDSGDQNIYFGYPTSTYHKEILDNGYNDTGIIPDIPIKNSVTDKIGFIVKYYADRN